MDLQLIPRYFIVFVTAVKFLLYFLCVSVGTEK